MVSGLTAKYVAWAQATLQKKALQEVFGEPGPQLTPKTPSRPSCEPRGAAPSPEVPQVNRLLPPITRREDFEEPPPVRLVLTGEQVVQTLTACLDDAPCRESARLIFRALYFNALEVARMQGHAASVTRGVFHLPAELLMDHLELKKSAFYDNLGYLRRMGLVACKAHMGDLRGRSVATGTVWVVALQPERVLNGQAPRMVLRREDWERRWRDLNADVKVKRTAYARTGGRKGKKETAGQSRNPDEEGEGKEATQKSARLTVTLDELVAWAITPFLPQSPSDTSTVRQGTGNAENVVWELGDSARAKRHERGVIVDRQARTLAAAFGDGADALGFWRKLIWNLTRGIDAGESLVDDVAFVLARVLADVRHDLTMGGTPPKKPAAVVNAALGRAGLLDRLRAWEGQSVGSRPAA